MTDANPINIEDQVALITGASRRIGAAIAQRLHAAGMRVAVHYRSSESEALELRDRFNSARKASAAAFQADLITEGEPARLVAAVADHFGSIHALVNNASTFYPTPIGEIDEKNWKDLVGSNLKAPVFLSQAAAPYLLDSRGSIVNLVDIHASRPLKDHHVYGAAKAGLAMLTRSLARDLAPHVRVNGVSPGAIAWPEDGMTEETKQKILEQVPLGRSGDPTDIANAVLFLLRDATYSTGQIIAIDGGRSVGW